ncbi:MAG: hypothetical protein RSB57_10620, partial [Hungatella sp.]
KYIHTTEYRKTAIHHHLIINNVNDGVRTTSGYIRELWGKNGSAKFVPLYEDAEYIRLAEYLIKETEQTFRETETPFCQRYACSRNLINPQPEIRMRKAKKWKEEPKPRAGYYILPDRLYNGVDKMGYPYQRYDMVKINPKDSEWEVQPNGRKGGKKGVSDGLVVKRKPQ